MLTCVDTYKREREAGADFVLLCGSGDMVGQFGGGGSFALSSQESRFSRVRWDSGVFGIASEHSSYFGDGPPAG